MRRPATTTENVDNPTLFGERYFSKASVRILLSDTAADLTSLPTVTGDAPISLEYTNAGAGLATTPASSIRRIQSWPRRAGRRSRIRRRRPTTTIRVVTTASSTMVQVNSVTGFPTPLTLLIGGNSIACTGTSHIRRLGHPLHRMLRRARRPAVGTVVAYTVNSGYLTPDQTGTIGGCIKIEMKDTAGVYHDVTQEILAHGISGRNTSLTLGCVATEVNPDAIIRLERVRDNLPNCATERTELHRLRAACALRHARRRSCATRRRAPACSSAASCTTWRSTSPTCRSGSRGSAPTRGGAGRTRYSENGYCVYFSDRRNNRNAANLETGEYGWEDVINPASSAGTANGTLDTGEDVNQNGVLDTYGQYPSYNGVANSVVCRLDRAARRDRRGRRRSLTQSQAQNNRALLFRRALKLRNGGLGNIVTPGLTIVAENPVYIEGDYNANQASGFGDPHAATAVIADAVTILSNSWNDDNSFKYPYSPSSRPRPAQSYYRVAIIGGKNPSFPQPTGWASATDFGTDGGAHNFLRMLEGQRPDGELPRRHRDLLLQPRGRRHLQVLQHGLRRADPKLQLRHRLPRSVQAAADDAGLPRPEHADLLAGSTSRKVRT